MQPMDIVHYVARVDLEEGGVVRAVLDMCAALAERGHRVTLLTFDRSDVPGEWSGRDGAPSVVTLDRGALPRLAGSSAARARTAIAGAAAVHLHVPWDPVCRQMARLALAARVPYVLSIHGMLDDWCMAQRGLKKRLYLALGGRRLLERAAAVHCTAREEARQSSKWYPRGRPEVVPLIFDLAEYLDLPGPGPAREQFASALADDGEPTVLFLSRLHPKKGLDVLIETAGRLRDEGVPGRFVIAGTGDPPYEEALRRLVSQRDLGDRVSFLGFVSGRAKLSLYQASDLFLLPTHQENWGFVLIESLACGVPVVTTKGVDIWSELADSGGAAIEPAEPARLAAALRDLLSDAGRRRDMGDRGRAWVLETLEPQRVTGRYEALYAGLRG